MKTTKEKKSKRGFYGPAALWAAAAALVLAGVVILAGCTNPDGGDDGGGNNGDTTAPVYEIGDPGPAGGLICYVNLDGFNSNGVICHYLEAAPADLGTCQWGGNNTNCGATRTDIGTGAANTAALATHDHGTPSSGSGLHIAARACAGYSYGGYSDWFLPSKDELALMYTNLKAQELGGFSDTDYWSSSENDSNYAWKQNFALGSQGTYQKVHERLVRAVRAF
jgi:hypothetical protein